MIKSPQSMRNALLLLRKKESSSVVQRLNEIVFGLYIELLLLNVNSAMKKSEESDTRIYHSIR